MIHIVRVPFTTNKNGKRNLHVDLNGFAVDRSGKTIGNERIGTPDEWYLQRTQVFLDYTLKSLLNQSLPDFHIWFDCHPCSKAYFEKYDLLDTLENCADNIIVTFDWRQTICDSFGGYGKEPVLVTRIDSDDMLSKEALQISQDNIRDKLMLNFVGGGWKYHYTQKLLKVYNHAFPPTYTLRFDSETLDSPARWNSYRKKQNWVGLGHIRRERNRVLYNEGKHVIVGLHGQNESTQFKRDTNVKGKNFPDVLDVEVSADILSRFGIHDD